GAALVLLPPSGALHHSVNGDLRGGRELHGRNSPLAESSTSSVARMGFEPMTSSFDLVLARPVRIEQRSQDEDAEDREHAAERGDDLHPSTPRESDHAGSDREKRGCNEWEDGSSLTAGDLRGTHVH